MNIGIVGSGVVAQTLGTKLVELGHDVTLGTREPQKLAAWRSKAGAKAHVGSVTQAASAGEILFNCTAGVGSLEALHSAGERNLNGKVLIDVSNPLDFSKGMPPSLTVCNTDSLGEQIQRAFPSVKVVKSLNTVTAAVMVNPSQLSGNHAIFVCGNDNGARAQVTNLLKTWFGWKTVLDLGDITGARTTEMYLSLWVRLMGTLQTPIFNIAIVQ